MIQRRVLKFRRRFEVFPAAPFHFDATFHKPDHFPAADNEWEVGIRWQSMLWQGVPLGLKFENVGTVKQPKIALTIWSQKKLNSKFLESLLDEIEYRHQWQLDLTEFFQRFREDSRLGPIIDKWEGMRPLNHSSLYEYLIIAIVLQNATVRRLVNMMQALFEAYGKRLSLMGKNFFVFGHPQ